MPCGTICGNPYTLSTTGGYLKIMTPTPKEIINKPRVLELPAYGLDKSEITVKEVGDELTITSEKVDRFHATIEKTYVLSNVKLAGIALYQGVLRLEFVDSDNVKRHEVQ